MVLPSLCLLSRKHERDPSEDENSRQDTQPNALPSSTALGTAPSKAARMQRHGCWCQQLGDTHAARLAGRGEPGRADREQMPTLLSGGWGQNDAGGGRPISLETEKCAETPSVALLSEVFKESTDLLKNRGREHPKVGREASVNQLGAFPAAPGSVLPGDL